MKLMMHTEVNSLSPDNLSMSNTIDRMIDNGKWFAIAWLPESVNPICFGEDLPGEIETTFEVIPWLGTYADRVIFHSGYIDNLQSLGTAASIPMHSTSKLTISMLWRVRLFQRACVPEKLLFLV